jgi:hypothetical protein
MAHPGSSAQEVNLTDEERETLERWARRWSPPKRCTTKRLRHLRTVSRLTPNRAAMAVSDSPSAPAKTMRHRSVRSPHRRRSRPPENSRSEASFGARFLRSRNFVPHTCPTGVEQLGAAALLARKNGAGAVTDNRDDSDGRQGEPCPRCPSGASDDPYVRAGWAETHACAPPWTASQGLPRGGV